MSLPLTDPADRYHADSAFKQLVDMMEMMMHNANFTPSEMRIAATLASIHFEHRRIRRLTIVETDKRHELFSCLDNLHGTMNELVGKDPAF